MTFEEVRARFPVLERFAYLNAGTFGPLSRATLDAVEADQRRAGELGRGGKAYFEGMLETRERVRAALGAQIGAAAECIALTTSTTDGCNAVVRGLDLGPGDEVVTTDAEHFGLIGPLVACGADLRVARLKGRPADEAFDAIRAEVTSRTKLLALSHVVWLNGHRIPVAELREATGVPTLVDGAQGAGAIPVDATAVDFYTVSAQKWLCGPDSTGALYVREPERLRVSAPSYFAQAEYDLEAPSFVPKDGAARHDGGWLPTPSLAGLEAALTDLPEWRFDRAAEIATQCHELLEANGFEVVSPHGHSPLVSFRVTGNPPDLVTQCYERGVILRDMPATDLLRVSCGYWTSEDDLQRLVAALQA